MRNAERIQHFRDLHASGTFVMPNPHNVGTAKLLAAMGFPALASTSQGFAATLGQVDMTVTFDQKLQHVADLAAATNLPLNVDSERCFSETLQGVAANVAAFGKAGAAGCSIEDWNPATNAIDPLETSVARVAAAVEGAAASGMVVTARCENLLHGINDLDDVVARLVAYRDAGADVVYAPGLMDLDQIRRVIDETGVAVNVLLIPGGPSVAQLTHVGVRRISLGSALSRIADGAVAEAAQQLLDQGTIRASTLDGALLMKAFG